MSEFSCRETKHVVKTERSGLLSIYVQGNVNAISDRTPVFLTMHDVGSSHAEFHVFTQHPTMEKINGRAVFLHVDAPGHEMDASDLPEDFDYPSLQDLGEDLIHVLDYFKIKYVVTLGQGAGSNVLARFAMKFPNRVIGNVFLECTLTEAGVMEIFADKVTNIKLPVYPSAAELYLLLQRYGGQLEKMDQQEKIQIKELPPQKPPPRGINRGNLRHYTEAFLNRNSLAPLLKEKMNVDTLLVTGAMSPRADMVHITHTMMAPQWTTMLKLDDIGDVLSEAPHRLAHNILLFCQGLGLLSSLSITKMKFDSW